MRLKKTNITFADIKEFDAETITKAALKNKDASMSRTNQKCECNLKISYITLTFMLTDRIICTFSEISLEI